MSDNRRHTDVPELGWLDFLAACTEDPLVRAEGRDEDATAFLGRLVRFNLAVHVNPETAYEDNGLPRVLAERTKRTNLPDGTTVLVPTGVAYPLKWEELDWVSWQPLVRAAGRRAKVTVTGQSWFGEWQLYEGNRLVNTITRHVLDFPSHGAAIEQALRLHTRRA